MKWGGAFFSVNFQIFVLKVLQFKIYPINFIQYIPTLYMNLYSFDRVILNLGKPK